MLSLAIFRLEEYCFFFLYICKDSEWHLGWALRPLGIFLKFLIDSRLFIILLEGFFFLLGSCTYRCSTRRHGQNQGRLARSGQNFGLPRPRGHNGWAPLFLTPRLRSIKESTTARLGPILILLGPSLKQTFVPPPPLQCQPQIIIRDEEDIKKKTPNKPNYFIS